MYANAQSKFYSILNIIEPETVKQNTHFREAVSAKIKLLITIWYLATGMKCSIKSTVCWTDCHWPRITFRCSACYKNLVVQLERACTIASFFSSSRGAIWRMHRINEKAHECKHTILELLTSTSSAVIIR
jgi:hypothetical protein